MVTLRPPEVETQRRADRTIAAGVRIAQLGRLQVADAAEAGAAQDPGYGGRRHLGLAGDLLAGGPLPTQGDDPLLYLGRGRGSQPVRTRRTIRQPRRAFGVGTGSPTCRRSWDRRRRPPPRPCAAGPDPPPAVPSSARLCVLSQVFPCTFIRSSGGVSESATPASPPPDRIDNLLRAHT